MSKINTIVRKGTEYHDGYYMASRDIAKVEGKLLTIIELLGLKDEQLEAAKSEVRNILWGRGYISHGMPVTAEMAYEIHKQMLQNAGALDAAILED